MSQKLRDYQVLDVLCDGTFYKVRHKVTNDIFAWKAYDCSVLCDAQVKNIIEDVKIVSGVQGENLLRYYDTILHAPSRTLYLVVEHTARRSLAAGGRLPERGVWRLLRGAARALATAARLPLRVLRPRLLAAAAFVDDAGEPLLDCLHLPPPGAAPPAPPLRQLGLLLRDLCYEHKQCLYSDDLSDIISFLTDEKNAEMKPDVLLYHPTILANLECTTPSRSLNESIMSSDYIRLSDINKCDSQKAVELCTSIKPALRTHSLVMDSPIYSNVKPKKADISDNPNVSRGSLSPTIAALALELPGFVPRSRRALAQRPALEGPQQVSEHILSEQWMTRLIALRQREESLNKRERDLISKEIVNSPAAKLVELDDSLENNVGESANGITLPSVLGVVSAREGRGPRPVRRRRRASSQRARRSRYEDLDSSLSADPGDASLVVTAAKLTCDNMPRRNIFPEHSSKKVHFTPANPFAESDDSVMLTYYELGDVDGESYQLPRQVTPSKDITKFRYLDLEKVTSEKRAAMQQWHSSPNKQAKFGKTVSKDITNSDRSLRRTPSKSSIASKGSTTSGVSVDSQAGAAGGRAAARLSLAPARAAPAKTRRSLLPFHSFKTPFKFMSSTKS